MAKNYIEAIERQEVVETTFEQYTILSKDMGLYTWNSKSKTSFKSGRIYNYDKHLATWLLEKKNGEWKIIYGHESFSDLKIDSVSVNN